MACIALKLYAKPKKNHSLTLAKSFSRLDEDVGLETAILLNLAFNELQALGGI